MNPNKPRNSILSLFDPLAAPSTPERDVSSPDSASDKENDGPGQVTVFFNRIYTKQPPQQLPESPFKGKLIDFGDPSVDDESDGSLLDEDGKGLNFGDSDDESQRYNCVSPSHVEKALSPSRQPLADICLETVLDTASGTQSSNVLCISEENSRTNEAIPVSTATVAPPGAPLADVINSINLSAMSVTSPPSPFSIPLADTAPDVSTHNDTLQENVDKFPEITLCPPEAEHLISSHPETPVSSPTSVTSLRPAARRLNSNTSAADPRRTSVDLQSSFSLQMQSPEMSFDLLNDKISFLTQDSVDGGEDDTLDFKMSPKPMPVIAEEVGRQGRGSKADEENQEMTARPMVFSKPRKSEHSEGPQSAMSNAPHNDAELRDPVVRPRGMSSLFDTPNMSHSQTAALPVVPALRIMKKVWKMHDRTSSVSSSSTVPPDPLPRARSNTVGITNSASSSRSSSRSDLADVDDQQSRAITHGLILSEEQDIVLEAPKPRAVVRGLQRPPPGAQLPPSRQTGPDRMRMVRGGVQPSISAQRASLAKSTSATSRPSISHRSSVTPSVAPPARAIRPAPSSTTLRSHVPTPSTSSLRAPRRTSISNGMSSGARSALPLPSSRLPAPSGGIPTRLGGSKLSGVPRRVS